MQQTTNISSTYSEYCTGYCGFGFNGKEKDDEVSGTGNQYDYGMRMYNPRIGRFLSVDPLVSKFPSWSSYCAFNDNPIYFIDPTGKGAVPSIVYNNKGEPIKAIVKSTIYLYTDDKNIDLHKAADQIKTEMETTLNKGFTTRVYDKKPGTNAHKVYRNVPIEFEITALPVSTDEAVKLANENSENNDMSKNFVYVNNDGLNTARAGNSGAISLGSLGKVKAHELLHFLGFNSGVELDDSHWPNDDNDSYSNRLMFSAPIEKWINNADATQEDINGINNGGYLKANKGFGKKPLNNIYNKDPHDKETDTWMPINKNKTNSNGTSETVY